MTEYNVKGLLCSDEHPENYYLQFTSVQSVLTSFSYCDLLLLHLET